MNHFNYADIFRLVVPETILVITALVVLGVDLGAMRDASVRYRKWIGAVFALFGSVGALAFLLGGHAHGTLADGMLVVDPLTQLVKFIIIVLTLFTIAISIEADFTEHIGEYFALLLFATVGMMFLVSSENLLMIFVSLELTSLSLYILAAFNKRDPRSAEAALKYFLFGGMAAAFTLFGLSLIYGLTASVNLTVIAEKLHGAESLDPLLAVALVMTVIGFGFKIAAVPFHLWAPDAYEGAPTPSTAFIASGSKVASFFILARIMMVGFAGDAAGDAAWQHLVPGWVPLLAVLAAFSLLLGNLAALAQTNVKRLIAYSAIAHAGYALLAVLSNSQVGLASLVYYVATYAATTLGAFGVVSVVEERNGGSAKLTDLAGLSKRAPVLSLCMMVFMLSLAGIPPLAGFFGKFYVFLAAVGAAKQLGLLWLVIFAIAMSAVSLYYYLQVLKQIYVAPAPADAPRINAPATSLVALVLLALVVVVLGCVPDLLLLQITEAISAVTGAAAH